MVLREAGLVTDRREGWNVYYRVTRPEVYALLDAAFAAAEPAGAQTRMLRLQPKPAACPCPKCQGEFAAEETNPAPWGVALGLR
jgi:ArsR family transcriptional regulator